MTSVRLSYVLLDNKISKFKSVAAEEQSIKSIGAGQQDLAVAQAKTNDIASNMLKGEAAQILKISDHPEVMDIKWFYIFMLRSQHYLKCDPKLCRKTKVL